ncbi:Calpain-C-like protein [Daphnia magna]|uniref:Calpain-C-like protein n=1 Tax=Daphnia magna TaxID=35525 RepID=A0A0P6BX67_9CRUS|nr:Calpain-C-like protein [Daphnia magna]
MDLDYWSENGKRHYLADYSHFRIRSSYKSVLISFWWKIYELLSHKTISNIDNIVAVSKIMYNLLGYVSFHGNRMRIHHIYFDQCEELCYRWAANKVEILSEESVPLLRLRCPYVRTRVWLIGTAAKQKNWDKSVSVAESE